MAVSHNYGHLAIEKDNNGNDQATIQVVIIAKLPVTIQRIPQIALNKNGVEGTRNTGRKAIQRANERKMQLSLDPFDVPNNDD